MSDETKSGASDAPTSTSTSGAEAPTAAGGGADQTAAGGGADQTAKATNGGASTGQRKRRRGSRGGRNRNRSNRPSASGAGEQGDRADAGGDTGISSGDLDAGDRPLADTTPSPAATGPSGEGAKPKIGDTRPAPPPPPRGRASAPTAEAAGEGEGPERAGTTPRSGGRGSGGPARGGRPAPGGRSAGGRPAVEEAEEAEEAEAEGEAEAGPGEGGARRRRRRRGGRGRRRGAAERERPTGRYLMCVHVKPGVATQVALLEGRQLVEHYVSRPQDDTTQIHGNIYLGKVQNVLPGMEAAFVDIGTPKNGVLYRSDVSYDESEFEGGRPRIERVLKNGQMVIVQVTKNPIGSKGARLTQEISLAGRYVVMVPEQPGTYGISKRLPDDERKRLRSILDAVKPKDAGLIVRTAAQGASKGDLERDVHRLKSLWGEIQAQAKGKTPKVAYKEPDLAIRMIREEFNQEYRGILIDDRNLYQQVRSYVEDLSPDLADRIEYYDDPELGVFERYHVEEQLQKALDRKVWLPSGGSLVIEHTEAFTVIDVNTSKFTGTGGSNLEETVYRNNLEAAEEVARQLRLRDIGGIIVIDFIDMEIAKNRDEVLRVFKDALARDKTRTQVYDISELGLVEMTRKRVAEDLVEAFSQTCPTCNGRGLVLDEELL